MSVPRRRMSEATNRSISRYRPGAPWNLPDSAWPRAFRSNCRVRARNPLVEPQSAATLSAPYGSSAISRMLFRASRPSNAIRTSRSRSPIASAFVNLHLPEPLSMPREHGDARPSDRAAPSAAPRTHPPDPSRLSSVRQLRPPLSLPARPPTPRDSPGGVASSRGKPPSSSTSLARPRTLPSRR